MSKKTLGITVNDVALFVLERQGRYLSGCSVGLLPSAEAGALDCRRPCHHLNAAEEGVLGDDLAMDPSLPKVTIELWRSDAIVLFDWLSSTDLNAVPITHPAEKQALADLHTRLEHSETDIPGVTQKQIDVARAEVAADMGW